MVRMAVCCCCCCCFVLFLISDLDPTQKHYGLGMSLRGLDELLTSTDPWVPTQALFGRRQSLQALGHNCVILANHKHEKVRTLMGKYYETGDERSGEASLVKTHGCRLRLVGLAKCWNFKTFNQKKTVLYKDKLVAETNSPGGDWQCLSSLLKEVIATLRSEFRSSSARPCMKLIPTFQIRS